MSSDSAISLNIKATGEFAEDVNSYGGIFIAVVIILLIAAIILILTRDSWGFWFWFAVFISVGLCVLIPIYYAGVKIFPIYTELEALVGIDATRIVANCNKLDESSKRNAIEKIKALVDIPPTSLLIGTVCLLILIIIIIVIKRVKKKGWFLGLVTMMLSMALIGAAGATAYVYNKKGDVLKEIDMRCKPSVSGFKKMSSPEKVKKEVVEKVEKEEVEKEEVEKEEVEKEEVEAVEPESFFF